MPHGEEKSLEARIDERIERREDEIRTQRFVSSIIGHVVEIAVMFVWAYWRSRPKN